MHPSLIKDRGKVLPNLQGGAYGVYCLQPSREDKGKSNKYTRNLCASMS